MSISGDFDPDFEYAEECLRYLMVRERQRPVFTKSSPQLSFRPDLIRRIRQLCALYKLSMRVKYLTIYIFDLFMDNHKISEEKLELTAICCVLIAAKVEENDHSIPKYRQLFSISEQYSYREVTQMEALVLKFFDWVFLTPTAASYIEYFYEKGLPEMQLNDGIKGLVDKYLDKTTDNLRFYSFAPSVVAASVLYCTRSALKLHPIWPKSVQNITNYSSIQMQECVQEIKSLELISRPLKTYSKSHFLNDSGFIDLCDALL